MTQPVEIMNFEAIGTHWSIEIDTSSVSDVLSEIRQAVTECIETFDRAYSRFRADSLVSQIAQTAGKYELPETAEKMIKFYRQLYDVSGGKVTPLIGKTLSDAGYDADYSLQPTAHIDAAPAWDEAMTYDAPWLTTRQPVLLDFGAAGKGYLVDLVGDVLAEHGVQEYCIDASGDILRKTTKGAALRIGLEDPDDPTLAIGVVELGNGSICGSAINRRKWGDMHHVMDPDTAQPVRGVVATWANASTAMEADGLATALFFVEPEKLASAFTYEYLVVHADRTYATSPMFARELFVEGSR